MKADVFISFEIFRADKIDLIYVITLNKENKVIYYLLRPSNKTN